MKLKEKVEKSLEKIRPYLLEDGGDVEVVAIDKKNNLLLRLKGNCQDCPMSEMTMKNGIIETLRKDVEEINEITTVDSSENGHVTKE